VAVFEGSLENLSLCFPYVMDEIHLINWRELTLSGEPVMTLVCSIWVASRTIQLCVYPLGAEDWRWSIQLSTGQTLQEGTMPTKLAAQVASQRVFEGTLRRAGLNVETPTEYKWQQVLS